MSSFKAIGRARGSLKEKLTLCAPEIGWPAVEAWAKIVRLREHIFITAIRWVVDGRSFYP